MVTPLKGQAACHTVTTHFFTGGNQGLGTRLLSRTTQITPKEWIEWEYTK